MTRLAETPLIGLAPMAGVGDLPMRALCYRMGAQYACTEMVSAVGWMCAKRDNPAYQQLLETTLTPDGKPDAARVADLAGKLNSEFGGTAYAQYGSLFVAKVAVDSGKLDDAATELKAIVDKPANPALGEIARQRLAQVLGAQNKAEDGLKLLDGDADKAFLATREELKGDLLVQLGRTDDANKAYQKAKAALSDEAAVGGLQIKLDDLAKGDA